MTPTDCLGIAAEARREAAACLRGSSVAHSHPADAACGQALLARLLEWLADPAEVVANVDRTQAQLLGRLQARGVALPNAVRPIAGAPVFRAQFDAGFDGLLGTGVLRGVRARGNDEISLAGLIGGAPMDAVAAWMLATSVVTSIKARPERPIVLVLETAPQPIAMDESTPLSEYLAHLARVISWARSQAVAVNVWIVGSVDVASYVACAADAARTVAFPGSTLHFEPMAGLHAAVGAEVQVSPPWLAAGLVDALTDGVSRVDLAWNGSA